MSRLRLLNFDDLFLLQLLKDGATLTQAAKQLNLTQPAVTQRLKKIEYVFKTKLFKKIGRNLKLTREGFHICDQGTSALAVMHDLKPEPSSINLNVGTRPEVGRSWLWPAIVALRKSNPQITLHLFFGSGEEILAGLHAGKLDVVLSSTPIVPRGLHTINVAQEEYVFAAAPSVVSSIKSTSDLKNYVLIEHDHSMPFLHYLAPTERTKLSFKDIWFVENTVLMTNALCHGFGVGIIPLYLAKPLFAKKKLDRINLKVSLAHDFFKLIARTDRDIGYVVDLLAKQLDAAGLA